MPRFGGTLPGLLEEDRLDEDISVMMLERVPKTRDF